MHYSIEFSAEMFADLPLHFYSKGCDGKICYANDRQAKCVGFSRGAELVGLTNFDFYLGDYAPSIVKNDQAVAAQNKPQMFMEPGRTYEGQRFNAVSYKFPWHANNRVIGIVGASMILNPEDNVFTLIKNFMSIIEGDNPGKEANPYKLSARQLDCLYFLVRGKSDKEIAKELSVSHRTVETHVNEIKHKMYCATRSQIIEKIFNEGVLNLLPRLTL